MEERAGEVKAGGERGGKEKGSPGRNPRRETADENDGGIEDRLNMQINDNTRKRESGRDRHTDGPDVPGRPSEWTAADTAVGLA